MPPAVLCSKISKRFGQTEVLSDLSLEVAEGEMFFLLGASGSGKTTLLRILSGLLDANTGTVEFFGKQVQHLGPEHRGLGMVFQNYALWPHLNVLEHVEFGLKNKRLSSEQIKSKVDATLALLQIEALAQRYPHELSGGQQQRVSLARALAPEPRILLLDEPLSNLDPRLRDEMRAELRRVQRQLNLTFIYVTHDRNEAFAIGDRAALLNSGRLQQIAAPLELYQHPRNAFVASFLGDCNFFSGRPSSGPEAGVSTELGFWKPSVGSSHGGGEVFLAVRPEDLVLHPVEASHAGEQATVVEIVRLGPHASLRIKIDSGKIFLVSTSLRESLRWNQGDRAKVLVNWARVSILEN